MHVKVLGVQIVLQIVLNAKAQMPINNQRASWVPTLEDDSMVEKAFSQILLHYVAVY